MYFGIGNNKYSKIVKKKCLLILGASSGIGRALACQLAPHFEKVYLHGRTQAALETLVKELQHPDLVCYTQAIVTFADITKLCAWLSTISTTLFINAIGGGCYAPLLHLTQDRHKKELLLQQALPVAAALAVAKKHHTMATKGDILLIGSALAYTPAPGFTCYSMGKVYLRQWTALARYEWKNAGIGVYYPCPGPTLTQFHARASQGNWRHTGGAMRAEAVARSIIWQWRWGIKSAPIGWRAWLAWAMAACKLEWLLYPFFWSSLKKRNPDAFNHHK